MVGRPFAQAEAGRCVLYRARNPVAAGIGLNFTPLDPIKALYWSAVINGVLAPPVMVLMMLLVRRKKVMGELQVEGWLYWLGWLATIAMGLSVVGMAFSLASSQG
jgi:Mn2+/Fe2+ NRAMP family transporter